MDQYIELGSSGQAVGYPVLAQNLGYVFAGEEITPANMLKRRWFSFV